MKNRTKCLPLIKLLHKKKKQNKINENENELHSQVSVKSRKLNYENSNTMSLC